MAPVVIAAPSATTAASARIFLCIELSPSVAPKHVIQGNARTAKMVAVAFCAYDQLTRAQNSETSYQQTWRRQNDFGVRK
jgi:hypothetical protein